MTGHIWQDDQYSTWTLPAEQSHGVHQAIVRSHQQLSKHLCLDYGHYLYYKNTFDLTGFLQAYQYHE